jgi:hypothetical protein
MPTAARDPENENLKAGNPPSPATGSDGSRSSKTRTDPASGETHRAGHGDNKSAAEDRPPAAHEDRRVKPV